VESSATYTWARLGECIKRAAPLGGVLVALYFSNQMGILVLGTLEGNVETGYFASAMRFFDNMTLVAAALMGAFLPSASGLYVRSSGAFSETVEFAMKHVFILAAPIGCGVTALAEPITHFLYGPQFAPAVQDLRILGGALVISYMNYVADSILIATDKEKLLFRITCFTAVIHVASSLALVSLFSHAGAAMAVVVTQLCYLVLLLYGLRGTIHVGRFLTIVWRPMLFAVAMGVLVYAIQNVNLILLIILGGGFYSICLVAGGVVPIQQVLSLGDVFLRKKPGK
jgi:O-antigen/teichoic acid export membrane protein